MPDSDTILSKMTPGHLEVIRSFAEPAEETLFSLESDISLGAASSISGWQLRKNAILFIQLTQIIVAGKTLPEDQVRFMMIRAGLISSFALLGLIEELARHLVPDLPHVCARIAAVIYWEMCARIVTICEEFAPEILPRLSVRL